MEAGYSSVERKDAAGMNSKRPRWTNPLSIFLYAIVAFHVVWMTYAALSLSLPKAWDYIKNSPWSMAALYDYGCNAVFSFIVLWFRDGPSLFGINGRYYALIFPWAGNCVVLAYAAFLFQTHGNSISALLPKTGQPLAPQKVAVTAIFGVIFVVCTAVQLQAQIRAWREQSLLSGLKEIIAEPWAVLTVLDAYEGNLFALLFVLAREGTTSIWISLLWIVFFVTMRSFAITLYALIVVREALARDVSFIELLFSAKSATA